MFGRFVRTAVAFLKKEDGPTAVEYAVMLALILVVVLRGGHQHRQHDERHVQQHRPARGQAVQ